LDINVPDLKKAGVCFSPPPAIKRMIGGGWCIRVYDFMISATESWTDRNGRR